MNEQILDATVQVVSADPDNAWFGTGFVFLHDEHASYLLTCAHVVQDVGGPARVRIAEEPAEVIADGGALGLDMAVLRVAPRLDRPALPLLPDELLVEEGASCRVAGFFDVGSNRRLMRPVVGAINALERMELAGGAGTARTLSLRLAADYQIVKGYSGAAVVDTSRGYVIGMVTHNEGSGRGIALHIAELLRLWPDCPVAARSQPRLEVAQRSADIPRPDSALAATAQELAQRVAAQFSGAQQDKVTALVRALYDAVVSDAAGTRHAALPADLVAVIEQLSGTSARSERLAVDFGAGNDFGNIQIQNMASGNIVHLNVHVDNTPPAPPVPAEVDFPASVYVCAAGDDESVAGADLRAALRLRGLRAWPAEQSGFITDAQVPALLARSVAATLCVSAESLDADDELSEAFERVADRQNADAQFPVLTLLDGVEQKQLRRAGFNPRKLGKVEPYSPDRVAGAARDLLRVVIERSADRLISAQTLEVGLLTFLSSSRAAWAPLSLDWATYFNRRYPTEDEWETVLLPALADLRAAVGGYAPHIRLYPQARLSAALAFGYEFREAAGYTLYINQRDDWWRTKVYEPGLAPLARTDTVVDPQAHDITIEVQITEGNVSQGVDSWIAASGAAVKHRVRLALPQGRQIDGPTAQAIACQVREAILSLRSPAGTTHIFGAIPAGLAVLIGWQFNACGPVQCYEWEHNQAYRPACLLR